MDKHLFKIILNNKSKFNVWEFKVGSSIRKRIKYGGSDGNCSCLFSYIFYNIFSSYPLCNPHNRRKS